MIGGWLYLMTIYGFGALRLPVASDFGDRIGAFRTLQRRARRVGASGARRDARDCDRGDRDEQRSRVGLRLRRRVDRHRHDLAPDFPRLLVPPARPARRTVEDDDGALGTLLVAWVLRLLVLRIGGARAVREASCRSPLG